MHLRKLLAAAATGLCFAAGAMAQIDATAPSQSSSSTQPGKSTKKKSRKSSSKSTKASSKTSKKRSKKKSAPTAATPSSAQPQAQGPVDDGEAPQISHQPVESGTRGKVLIVNLPGSPKGAVESLDAIVELVPHVLELLRGRTEHA